MLSALGYFFLKNLLSFKIVSPSRTQLPAVKCVKYVSIFRFHSHNIRRACELSAAQKACVTSDSSNDCRPRLYGKDHNTVNEALCVIPYIKIRQTQCHCADAVKMCRSRMHFSTSTTHNGFYMP